MHFVKFFVTSKKMHIFIEINNYYQKQKHFKIIRIVQVQFFLHNIFKLLSKKINGQKNFT